MTTTRRPHDTNGYSDMKLATFKANGRTSYGAVTDGGIVGRASRNIRRCSTCCARRRSRKRARRQRGRGYTGQRRRDAAADTGARQEHLRRYRLCRPQCRIQGRPGGAEISQSVLPIPDLPGGDRSAHHPARRFPTSSITKAIGLLVIGKEGRHVLESALSMIGGSTWQRRQRARLAAARQLECHPREEFRQVRRQCRPMDGHGR